VGEDRETNIYEVRGQLTRRELEGLLKGFGHVEVEQVVDSFIVHTSMDVSEIEFLGRFVQNRVRLRYFHNVGRSVRGLFEV
jgi:hypothetical protein